MGLTPMVTWLGYIISLALVLSAIENAAGDEVDNVTFGLPTGPWGHVDSFTVQPLAAINLYRTADHVLFNTALVVNDYHVNVSVAPSEGMAFLNHARVDINKVQLNSRGGDTKSLPGVPANVPSLGLGDVVYKELLLIRVEWIQFVQLNLIAISSDHKCCCVKGNNTAQLILRWNLTIGEHIGKPISGRGGRWLGMYLGVIIPLLLTLLISGAVGGYVWSKKKHGIGSGPDLSNTLNNLPDMPTEFRYRDLKKATNNFDDRRKLGEGAYGMVYKGSLPRHSAEEVAVKKFSRDHTQSKHDFLAELTIINRLRHRNLLKLLGWCHKKGMLLLVYEYMPNGSLDKHIFCPADKSPLCWELRFKVLTGVAHALQYLHTEFDDTVIHRDLKASNIMLDADFNARLGDFGLARAIDHEQSSYAQKDGVVHGTMGYIAPECFHTGKATRESDIYAFGAVLLEVACGLLPWAHKGGYQCLVDWVWSMHRDGKILEAAYERLGEDQFVREEVERVLVLGLACSHPIATERPKVQMVLQILSGSCHPLMYHLSSRHSRGRC